MSISGMVASKSKTGTGIKVDGTWYNGTTDMLLCVDYRDYAELEADDKRNIISIKKMDSPQGAAASGGTPPSGGGGGYNDSARQAVIVFQSARNASISLYTALAATDAVKLPTKQADKYEAAMAFINEHTEVFHEQAMQVYGGTPSAEALDPSS